jgi:hypothetical protein
MADEWFRLKDGDQVVAMFRCREHAELFQKVLEQLAEQSNITINQAEPDGEVPLATCGRR